MPRPNPKAPGPDQEAMFDTVPRSRPTVRGRHSLAADKAIAAATQQGYLAEVDDALAATIRASMWALDEFEASGKPYGPAKLIGPLTEALREAHMTPESRRALAAAQDDKITELINELAKPEIRDPA